MCWEEDGWRWTGRELCDMAEQVASSCVLEKGSVKREWKQRRLCGAVCCPGQGQGHMYFSKISGSLSPMKFEL